MVTGIKITFSNISIIMWQSA